MKRFIDLKDQTGNIDYEEGEREFAFYCTVQGKFETIFGSQTWTTREDLIEDLKMSETEHNKERLIGLIPNDFK